MDPNDVERPSDIVSAADALLKSTPRPPDATPTPDPEAPASDPAREDPAAPDGEPAAEGAPPDAVDDAVDTAPKDDLAERQRLLDEREAKFNQDRERAEAHFRKALEDPAEYERIRRELGIAQPKPAEPPKPAGPDPIQNPDAWRYRRTLVYQREAAKTGANWTADAIQESVERDLFEAREAVHAERLAKLEERIAQRERQEHETAALTRQQAEQQALDQALAPLTRAAYPTGVPPEAKEDIDAHVALARARGQKPDLAAIVAKVSGRAKAAITTYVTQKKVVNGAGAARSTGGQSPAPVSMLDRLPADTSSIGKLGEMLAEGKLKR